jgi:hypothetical protein
MKTSCARAPRISFKRLALLPAGLLLAAALLLSCGRRSAAGETSANPEINVILWFDFEDYLLPADDDAAKRLCEMLTARGIRATFKIVGEKARVLEKRGRRDVIAALKKHDVGYHSNLHSVHPTVSEYLAGCAFLDGVAEFVRREGGGAADVRRIFGVDTLACYGQPGASWAPQAIAALPELKIAPRSVPCYVDEGSHIGLDGKPFWYVGAINVFNMMPNFTRMELHDAAAVEPANREFSAITRRLRSQEGGGLVSILYHPCEWVHLKFWDGENFERGANPPREQWKAPAQRTAQETDEAFERFGSYLDHMRRTAGVAFITASDLPLLYPDLVRTSGASKADLAEIAAHNAGNDHATVDFIVVDGRAFSLADQFEVLTGAVCQLIRSNELSFPLVVKGVLGPDSPATPARASASGSTTWPAFRDAVLDVQDYLQVHRRVPARVYIGAEAVPPADFMAGLACAVRHDFQSGTLPLSEGVALGHNVEVLPARRVAQDTPELFGGWVIHPAGFRAPKILEVARLQAWTLKPAIRKR